MQCSLNALNCRALRSFKYDIKHVFVDAAPDQYADLKQIVAEYQPDVLIVDSTFAGATFLKEIDGIPLVGYGVTPLSVSSQDTAPMGLAMPPNTSPLGRVRNKALYWLLGDVVFRDVSAHRQAGGKR